MKLSRDNREGFEQLPPGVAYNVFVDGVKVERVLAVDTDAGIAWINKIDKPNMLKTVEVHGVITLEQIA